MIDHGSKQASKDKEEEEGDSHAGRPVPDGGRRRRSSPG
jgi:hypothetical protein